MYRVKIRSFFFFLNKELENIKAAREKEQITYKGIVIRLPVDFSEETVKARSQGHDVFKVMKGKSLQPRIFYPSRFSFRYLIEKLKASQTSKS